MTATLAMLLDHDGGPLVAVRRAQARAAQEEARFQLARLDVEGPGDRRRKR